MTALSPSKLSSDTTPAQRLQGASLKNGWTVLEPMTRPIYATGGHFSQGYVVQNADGRKGYLKALDYSEALATDDPASVLNAMTQAFLFERNVCEICTNSRLSRVVKAIDSGTINVEQGSQGVVQYLIFELADGDVRKHLDTVKAFEDAWALRALHHAATGLMQLHGKGIAHQDLKPSNMLVFPEKTWKVGDLGRAASREFKAPHDAAEVAGDYAYAPPELLYHYVDADWARRRFGCDAYLLGSMIVFLFTRSGMTAQMLDHLDPALHWHQWTGTFDEILPYLRDAHGAAIKAAAPALPQEHRRDLTDMVRQLCDPDPRLRGHPELRGRAGNQYSLERYISWLNLLAERAEVQLRKGL